MSAKEAALSVRPQARAFSVFAWVSLAYLALVILFGSFVRASLSGDGCGASWPLCEGELLPSGTTAAKVIEYTHRATSGISIIVLGWLYAWSVRVFEKGSPVRKAAGVAALTVLFSSLIGALLVLFRWVTHDTSAGRAVTMPLHLMNTYLMLAATLLCARWAGGASAWRWKGQGQVASAIKWAAGSMFVLGATGAFSALGKTAFEHELSGARGWAERVMMHVGPDAHPLLRGGVFHPLIATSVGLLVVWVCGIVTAERNSPKVRAWARWTVGLYVAQMALGVVNLVASAPVGLQLAHLALAILDWSALVMLASYALSEAPLVESSPTAAPVVPRLAFGARVKDFVALTKPRVVSLLLFTTVAAMFVAARGAPDLWLTLWVTIGGYMAAGSANAFNMVIERDLDVAMARTSSRPTVADRVTAREALTFAWLMGLGSFVLLWSAANLLSALMAMAGLLCYVFVYTLWLKRRTWQNIVIGGAAGAFPPLVGYAAVSGHLSPLAWYLFAVIFTWTPVHFWALALLIKDDYASAGVPMLPVVKGDKVTVNQIGLYTVLTSVVTVLPFFQQQAGPIYLIGAVLLNLGLIAQSLQLWRHTDRPHAKALFKYSMAYLALFFVVAAADQAWWPL